ncbi:hypothetical protein SR870_02340 [Rhodopseudomonas palustris]|uniref:hypothetical protein n=1 Tax=Rhodopseudomonas palustris TaxID=1076 RepID=UPI002ACDAA9C|nr:hypothetical protein [Rhodopseudomonas palustris]WQH00153.1 hypothetical protein SR870_02340 [Rhodopseudomonas palustris]
MWRATESTAAHQRARFMHPNATLWMRPDAERWIRPDVARFLAPGALPEDVFPALDRKYNPNQPRVPKGNPDGGEWTASGAPGQTDSNLKSPPTDISAQSRRRGHHFNPYAVFSKWNLRPETRKVFEDATTGTLARDSVRFDPEGTPYKHIWGGVKNLHREYNQGVAELGSRFLSENQITPESMTPSQARELLREIDISQDPRIRDFNRAMRMLRFIARVRLGRE